MAERVYCLYRGKDQESILMQKNACHDFAEKKGWNIVGEEQGEIIDGVDAERMLDYIRFWQTDEAQKL